MVDTIKIPARIANKDEVLAALETLKRSIENTGFNETGNLSRARGNFQLLHASVLAIGREIKAVAIPAMTLLGLSGAGVAASIYGVTRVVSRFAGTTADLYLNAKELGTTTQALKGFISAAEEVGFGPERANQQLRELSRNFEQIQLNIGQAKDALHDIGRDDIVLRLRGAKDATEALDITLSEIDKYRDTAPLAAKRIGEILLGDAEAMRYTHDAVAKQIKQALPVSKEEADNAIKFLRQQDLLGKQWDKLKEEIGFEVLPAGIRAMDAIKETIDRNPEALNTLAAGFGKMAQQVGRLSKRDVEGLGRSLGAAVRGAGWLLLKASKAFIWLHEKLGVVLPKPPARGGSPSEGGTSSERLGLNSGEIKKLAAYTEQAASGLGDLKDTAARTRDLVYIANVLNEATDQGRGEGGFMNVAYIPGGGLAGGAAGGGAGGGAGARPGSSNAGAMPMGGAVKGSYFNDVATASGLNAARVPGIALPDRSTLGQKFKVTTPDGRTVVLPQIDVGPAKWTGRGVDISQGALPQMGYTPGNFPTDSAFKVEPFKAEPPEPQERFGVGGPIPYTAGSRKFGVNMTVRGKGLKVTTKSDNVDDLTMRRERAF